MVVSDEVVVWWADWCAEAAAPHGSSRARLSPMPTRLAESSVCAADRTAPGANRFPVPTNLITIMVDARTSCHYSDIVSTDIDESINKGPSIDRFSIQVWAVITIDCGFELLC